MNIFPVLRSALPDKAPNNTGTPSVIIPTFSERESNARRIESLGAGEFLLPEATADGKKWVDTSRLRETVKRVLETPGYRECAERYGKILRSYGGIDEAVGLIEGLARGGTPVG